MSTWQLDLEQYPSVVSEKTQEGELDDLEAIVSSPRRQRYLVVKRGLDIVGAIVGLIVFSPAMVVAAILIKITSPGPVVFRHKRLGQYGREFSCLKLRSMVPNAELILRDWLANNPRVRHEFERDFKLKNDPRIIPVIGKVSRQISLDEVPQFLNVLRGDMSLIGPRPIVYDEVPKYGDAYSHVALVKPGLTGLWQVSGRNDVGYGERVELDLRYIRRMGFWGDVRIVARTIRVVLSKYGAY